MKPRLPGVPNPSDEKTTRESLQARFEEFAQPAVLLAPSSTGGFSRLGGLPRLPPETEWPMWNSKPQAFLAQLDLSEIHRALPSFLPATGYLYFFYDQEQGVWGFDPKDAGGWRVLYSQGDLATFQETPAPAGLTDEFIYNQKLVSAKRIDLLPDSQRLPKGEYVWKRDGDAYLELREEVFAGRERHQVLGFPSPVQGDDMELECQLASSGIYVGDAAGYKDPRVEALRAGADDWKLLLQLDTDDDTGWMWGDVGTLYFWIRESDARRSDFSKVWMVFQCC